jgi:enamine deaminase RidA (YjgF/YER057c/UK114 family)
VPREVIQPKGVFDSRPWFAKVVKHGKLIYIAGQTSVDANGNLVGKGDIEDETHQVASPTRE